MLREIYNKDPDDPNYKADQIEVTDPLEACIGKIKMLIFTRKGEVLGDSSFGLDLESLVYELNLSEESIKKEIQEKFKEIRGRPRFFEVFENLKKYSEIDPGKITIKYILTEDNKETFKKYNLIDFI